MIDWQAGNFISAIDAWQFDGGSLEIIVPGTVEAPSSHWLSIAKDVIASIDRHRTSAAKYLDGFVDRERIDRDSTWELESAEFGMPGELANVRFVLYFHLTSDQYGLWSVAFQGTGLPEPNDVVPSRFQRQQQ